MRVLLEQQLDETSAAGYARVRLDTQPSMRPRCTCLSVSVSSTSMRTGTTQSKVLAYLELEL